MKKITTIVLARHGQSTYNAEDRFTGTYDAPLTARGREQAKNCAYMLQNYAFDVVIRSSLQRAIDTSQMIIRDSNSKPIMVTDTRLNERDYGHLTGLNKHDSIQKYGENQVFLWRRGFETCPPGGESLQQTLLRVQSFCREKLMPLASQHSTILIVAHGNSLRAMILELLKLTPDHSTAIEVGWCTPWVLQMHQNVVTNITIHSDSDHITNTLPSHVPHRICKHHIPKKITSQDDVAIS
tara:strand:+ start:2130 stop:2846 length:717 start_codon:yes stop_codon:yes gene_type:complete